MWFAFQQSDQELKSSLMQCMSFPISFQHMVWWIYHWKGVILHGSIFMGMSIGPELTVFFFQRIGRITFQISLKEGCVAFRPLPDSLRLWKILEGQKMIQIRECVVKGRRYVEKVRTWWESYQYQQSPSYRLANKLIVLKMDLKKWNEEDFRNVEVNKNKLWSDINELGTLGNSQQLIAKEKELEKDENTTLLEEISCRQKSRVLQ